MIEPAVNYQRLAGAALGLFCGDALGMPFEGQAPETIALHHGLPGEMLAGRFPAGSYTDDTQMMIGILETLAEKGRLDPAHLAGRFAANFEPARGYGRRIAPVMQAIKQGRPWDQVGTDSFGNGGAMRVGPLGAFYADDEEALIQAALDQCRITHQHPQGLAGALALALAVGLAAQAGAAGQKPEPGPFCRHIAARVAEVNQHTASRVLAVAELVSAGDGPKAARARLVSEYARDVTAPESAPPAMGAFLAADSAGQAISLAVSLGGDADTIGAMAGSLAGAFWGLSALPAAWLAALENGPAGREYVLSLCQKALSTKEQKKLTPGLD